MRDATIWPADASISSAMFAEECGLILLLILAGVLDLIFNPLFKILLLINSSYDLSDYII
jgi:hypothetical protein